MNTIVIKDRKTWVDALRALAIILVVLGHQMRGVSEFFIFTSPVKMPLFFAISGYLFKMRDGDSKTFFRNWFLKLIIPWFCLALMSFLPKLFMGESLMGYIGDLISGKVLWFMPCFVIAEVIHFYARKIASKDIVLACICIFLTVLGLFLHYLGVLNYAMVNRALSVQFFFFIGYLFKQNEKSLIGLSWTVISMGGLTYLVLIFLSLYLYPKTSIDVHFCRYYNYPLCFALILLGIIVLFIAAAKSNIRNRLLSIIGQNTLVLYIWHGGVIWVLKYFMAYFNIIIPSVWVGALIKTSWAVLICNVLANYLNKYVPELVGRTRKARL